VRKLTFSESDEITLPQNGTVDKHLNFYSLRLIRASGNTTIKRGRVSWTSRGAGLAPLLKRDETQKKRQKPKLAGAFSKEQFA
jgi:hypothetical protein